MSLRLSGLNPLSYMGVEPAQPPNLLVKQAAPTANDFQNINIGTFWLVYPNQQLWFLISVVGGTATWVQLYPAGGGGGGASQFPTDDGTANEVGGVLNVLGDGNIITHGAGNTITLTMAGDFVENFVTDAGTAHPSSNTLRVLGGTNMNTSGTSNAVTINLDDSVSLAGSLGVSGATTLDGSLTLTGRDDGVLQTNGSGVVSATNGTDGQVLIGGGTAPTWANLTSDGGTVIITNGPNSINLESTGGGGGSPISFYAYQATDYFVPASLSVAPLPYLMGTAVALTTSFNNGGGFFPGDGVGTPASFTAPVTGSYFFTFNLALRNGVSPNNNMNFALAQILTNVSSQTYSSFLSNNVSGAPFNYNRVDLSANATLQLTAGQIVTFQAIVNAVTTSNSPAYVVSGPQPVGGSFGPATITSIHGFLVSQTSSGGGGSAGSIAFYGYQPTPYQVPLTGSSGTVDYSWGTAVPFTTTVNEGGGFYPGDGAGTPASFTAPVKGIYFFEAAGQFRNGFAASTSVATFYGSVQIVTPLTVYSGATGEPSGATLGQQGGWFGVSGAFDQSGTAAKVSAIAQLNAGDVVTFYSSVNGSSTITPAPGRFSHVVSGVISPGGVIDPTVSCPATYVEGFLLKQL